MSKLTEEQKKKLRQQFDSTRGNGLLESNRVKTTNTYNTNNNPSITQRVQARYENIMRQTVNSTPNVQNNLPNVKVSQQMNTNTGTGMRSTAKTSNVNVGKLPTLNGVENKNSTPKRYEENKNAVKKSSDIGYTVKKTGAGILSGLTGLLQAQTTDLANNLKEGKEKSQKNETENNIAKKTLNAIIDPSSLVSLANPTNYAVNTMIDGAKNTVDILKDNEKNPLKKAVEIGTNAVSGALDMVSPFRQIIKPTEQAIRKNVAR